jgi:Tfp pilus assembly protein PilV
MKKTQSGFALVESLLIILILVIIGFGGYYVWHTQKQTDKTLDTAAATSQKAAQTESNNAATLKYLTIPEWGVKGAYTGNVDLTYKITSDDIGETWAQLSSKQLKAAAPECDEQSQMGGIIVRIHKGEDLRGPAGQDTGQTVDEAVGSQVLTEFSLVGDYYYYFEHPQAACSTSQKATDAQSLTLDSAKNAAKNLKAL